MSKLSSLLVKNQLLSAKQVADALQRQVIYGGDLDINLLELGFIGEEVLAEYSAKAHNLDVLPLSAIADVDHRVLKMLPWEVVNEYRLFPVRLYGDKLIVATSKPVDLVALNDATFLVGVLIVPQYVTEIRLAMALDKYYGIPIMPRLLAMAQKIDPNFEPGRQPVVAFSNVSTVISGVEKAPFMDTSQEVFENRVVSLGPPKPDEDAEKQKPYVTGDEDISIASSKEKSGELTMKLGKDVSPPSPPPRRPPPLKHQPGDGSSTLEMPVLRSGERPKGYKPATKPDTKPIAERISKSTVEPAAKLSAEPVVKPSAGPAKKTPVQTPAQSKIKAAVPPQKAPVLGAQAKKPIVVQTPISFSHAAEKIKKAEKRDEILDIFFSFGSQAFDFTAMLLVHDVLAQGRLATFRGKESFAIDQVSVPLNNGGVFETVFTTKGFHLGPPADCDGDKQALLTLGRDNVSNFALVPICVRHRVIILLYGDCGQEGVRANRISRLAEFGFLAGEAFERILMAQKLGKYKKQPSRDVGKINKEQLNKHTTKRDLSSWVPAPTKSNKVQMNTGLSKKPVEEEGAAAKKVEPVKVEMIDEGKFSFPPSVKVDNQVVEGERETLVGAFPEHVAEKKPAPKQKPFQSTPLSVPADPVSRETLSGGISQTTKSDFAALSTVGTVAKEAKRDAAEDDRPVSPPKSIDTTDLQHGKVIQRKPVRFSHSPRTRSPLDVIKSESVEPAKFDTGIGPMRTSEPVKQTEAAKQIESVKMVAPSVITDAPAVQQKVEVVKPTYISETPDKPTTEPSRKASSSEKKAVSGEEKKGVSPEPSIPASPVARSVQVEMQEEIQHLIKRVTARNKPFDQAAAELLLGIGVDALEQMLVQFPGPLLCDRYQESARLQRVSQHGPLLRAIVMFGKKAVPFVMPLLNSLDSEVRFYATFLFSEIGHPDALASLVERVFDNDRQTRYLAMDVVRRFYDVPEFRFAVKDIADVLTSSTSSLEKKRMAAEALGELADPIAIRPLAEMLGSVDGILAERSHQSLVNISFNDFGFSERRWVAWIKSTRGRHRIEWAIESTNHKIEEIRNLAISELKRMVGDAIDWPKGPPDHRYRREVKRRCLKWWELEGRALRHTIEIE